MAHAAGALYVAALSVVLGGCSAERPTTPSRPTSSARRPSRAAPAAPAPSSLERAAPAPSPATSSLPAVEAAASRPALIAPAAQHPLAVDGFHPAVVSVPLGATQRAPTLIALHGNYDRPEWQCELWRYVVGPQPFIVCPRGIPRAGAPKAEDRWEYGSVDALSREIDAGLAALAARYPEHARIERPWLAGFSLGAILGRVLAQRSPARFSAYVFVEGGFEGWSPPTARRFRDQGGGRVLFACGQGACVAGARAAARTLGLDEARVVAAPGEGHTYGGQVAERVREAWPWLLGAEEGPTAP